MMTSDWIGIIGVTLVLLAYTCNIFRWLSSRSRLFLAINAIGAILTCVASFMNVCWPLVFLGAAWTLVSLIGLIKVTLPDRQ